MTHSNENARRFVLALGALSGIALVGSFLALTDIAHGEPDLTLEWAVLRVGGLVVVTFHVAAVGFLLRMRGRQPADP